MDVERQRVLDRAPNYDHDFDGRPLVGWQCDPLLERLCRYHPELMPPELIKQLATNRRREPILASALD